MDVRAGRDRIPAGEWVNAPGGEGSHHAVDPRNPNIVYSHSFYGNFTRQDLAQITGRPEGADGRASGRDQRAGVARIRPQVKEGEPELRAQWMAPILISPHDPDVVYAGYQFVFRSANRGDAWERISPDLTENDPSQMLLRSSSAVPYQTIVALAESPRIRGLLYAGTDDGRVHVTQDGGRSWTDLTRALPTRRWISRVVPSQHADATVYVTQRGREDDDFGVYIYRSTDYGKTFTSLASNIPAGSVNVLREDPENPDVLYVGTDFGAFVSTTGGGRWEVLGGGLPSVQVSDLQFHPRDRFVVVATYGRGMYALDAMRIESRQRLPPAPSRQR